GPLSGAHPSRPATAPRAPANSPHSMSAPLRAFVNGRAVDVSPGGSALDAVRAHAPALAAQPAAGTRAPTDSRGLPVTADSPVVAGAIPRVVPVRNRSATAAPE